MVSKCANPHCSARMKYMHDGSVFAVRKPLSGHNHVTDDESFGASPGTEVEWFWLCEPCSRRMRVSRNGCLVCVMPNHIPEATFDNFSFLATTCE